MNAEFFDTILEGIVSGTFDPIGPDRVLNPEVPLESPLEYELERVICKYAEHGSRVSRQFRIFTNRGTFRVDFVLKTLAGLIGFECDGKQFHDWTRDIFRDTIILENSDIDCIYRLEGADICYRLETALLLISKCHDGIFSERGVSNLWALSDCRDDVEMWQDDEGIYGQYEMRDEDAAIQSRTIRIRRLSRNHHHFQLMLDVAEQYRTVRTENLWGIMMRDVLNRKLQ